MLHRWHASVTRGTDRTAVCTDTEEVAYGWLLRRMREALEEATSAAAVDSVSAGIVALKDGPLFRFDAGDDVYMVQRCSAIGHRGHRGDFEWMVLNSRLSGTQWSSSRWARWRAIGDGGITD
jgi:hypothetical protein